MIWSKLKKRIESGFADTLKSRIKLYITSYGSDYDTQDLYNRGWITLDGNEVVNFSTPDAFFIHGRDLNATTPSLLANTAEKIYAHRSEKKLLEKGEFSKYDLTQCCRLFLNMSIEEALDHVSPIIRMLAVLDRRTGKRTLRSLFESELHPLVRYFLELRLDAEIKSKPAEF